MQRELRTSRGFSLVELLVVIVIIAILMGLAFPAIMNAIREAKKISDLNNGRNIGAALLTDSMDHGGVYRRNRAATNLSLDGTSLDVMQGLLDDDYLDDPTVIAAEGAIEAQSMTLVAANVGFDYIAGHTSSSPSRMPMLVTKGLSITTSDLTNTVIDPGTSAWETLGVIVIYKGGNAEFVRGEDDGSGKMELSKPLGLGRLNTNWVVYKASK